MIWAGKTTGLFFSGLLSVTLSLATLAQAPVALGAHHNPIPELDCVIQPSAVVDVGSAVPGMVETLQVDRSDLVSKGAVVARLESSVERATLALAQARASLDTAIELRQQKAAFGYLTQQRNQALLHKSAISMHDMDQLKTETRIAKLQVKQERENKRIAELEYQRAQAVVQRRSVRSPVDGVVMERFKSVGEYVEDDPLLRVAQLDPLHVEVIVPVAHLGQITPGMQAQVTAVVPGADTHLAKVERVDRVADAASGTYGVRLSLANPQYLIPAGLRCSLHFLPQQVNQVVFETDAAKTEKDDTKGVSGSSMQASDDPKGTCYSIGPLSDKNQAQKLSKSVEKESERVAIRQESVSQVNKYIVLAAPKMDHQSKQELQLRLQAAGISDRYVITRGKNKGRTSLGIYNHKKSAHKRQRQLVNKGFDTEIQPMHQQTTLYWLDLSLKNKKALSEKITEMSATLPHTVSLEPTTCHLFVAHR